jgi:hypothetical protein
VKTRVGLTVGAALFLASLTAAADDTAGDLVGVGWAVSSVGGIVTGIGTGVALGSGNDATGWGFASLVTGIANLAYGTLFVVYAAGPDPCANSTSGWNFCFDLRGPAAALGVVNLTIGAVNGVLAAVALSRPWQPPSNVALAPLALDDAQGRKVPGVVVMGRF